MRYLICSACGQATTKDFSRCPFCSAKSLHYRDSFKSTGIHYSDLVQIKEVKGSHPMVSSLLVASITGAVGLLVHFCF